MTLLKSSNIRILLNDSSEDRGKLQCDDLGIRSQPLRSRSKASHNTMQGRAYSAMASDAVAVKLSRMAIVKEPNRADVTRPECSGPMEVHSTTPAEQTVAAPNGTTVGTASPSLVDRQDAEPVHASPPSHESKSPPIRNGRGETGDDSAGEWVGPLWHERRGCNVWVNSETGAVRLSP